MNMLKKKLSEKLGKNGGFTLVEMLIVVAIIAILVAVSIPLVSTSLEKARIATDAANERAAKAEILIKYLDNQVAAGAEYAYNATSGDLVEKNARDTEIGYQYGKCTTHNHQGGFILVSIDAKREVTVKWTKGDGNLCMNEVNSST